MRINSLFVGLIELYRITLSPVFTSLFGRGCFQNPTCSVYTQNAIREHGVLKGLKMGLARVLRCWRLAS